MNLNSKGFIKIILIVALLIFFAFIMAWLWQRQPKPKDEKVENFTNTIEQNPKLQKKQGSQFKPDTLSILNSNQITLEGKISANSVAVILTNDLCQITTTDSQGKFTQNLSLSNGLNLISVLEITNEPKINNKYNLAYFVDPKGKNENSLNIGTVKNIFEDVLTLSYENQDQNVKITSNSQIKIPLDQEEATGSPKDAIRVGDFAIAIGKIQKETLLVQTIEIVRENKPQINRKIILSQILTPIKKNAFSVKNLQTSDVFEFETDKNTKFQNLTTQIKNSEIQKGQKAIIIYNEVKNAKVIYLINILP